MEQTLDLPISVRTETTPVFSMASPSLLDSLLNLPPIRVLKSWNAPKRTHQNQYSKNPREKQVSCIPYEISVSTDSSPSRQHGLRTWDL